MAKEWCVEGLELRFTINGTDVTQTGIATISSQPSSKTKIRGHGVYFDKFECKFVGCSYNGYTQTSPANYSIPCGAQYSKEDNKPIMLVEDNQIAEGISFQQGQSSTTYNIKCEVSYAGQNDVREN